ncbi:VC0807 family protein [Haloferula sp. BvORR071]|uniref:VC0807 family protein n=1 Tax=Haloferula sp. BvORR071 TaxID=1396141 RepID=UPI0005518C2B|nr:VC0807 family protein [Haloferula sp. BvORR071]
MPETKPKPEHPLANILVNVIVPALVLSYLSKDPALQVKLGKAVRPWHIGPLWAMIVALALPLGYGAWHFIQTRKANFFSAIGVVSVLATGLVTYYLWNKDGTVKPNAGLLFGIKEALIPLFLAFAILGSRKSQTPLIRLFLYNDTIFDVPKIESKIEERGETSRYAGLLDGATKLFAGSFFLSSLMNLGLAQWFFRGFDANAIDALETYNSLVGKLNWSGLIAIGVPLMGILFLILTKLLKGLRELTGLKDEELMLPR